ERKKNDGIAPHEPECSRGRARLLQSPLRNEYVNRHTAAHGQRIAGFEGSVRAADLCCCVTLSRSVCTGKRLRAKSPGRSRRQVDTGLGVIDRHWPIVAR